MTEHEWTILAGLIDEWWPFDFSETAERAWFVVLESFDADTVAAALRAILLHGTPKRPSIAEVLAELRKDAGAPIFSEAIELIYGRGGVLSARTPVRKGSWEAGERDRLNEEASWERAEQMHPLIAAFIRREGLDRLRSINLQDPEYGEARRHQLETRWKAFRTAVDDRQIASIAAGRGAGQLVQLDPLTALGIPPDRRQLQPATRQETSE